MNNIYIYVLIPAVIGLISLLIKNNNSKEIINNINNEETKMKLPRFYLVVGIVDVLFTSSLIVFMWVFPNETTGFFPTVIFSLGALLGVIIITISVSFEIIIYRSKDYFLYRTIFFKKYKINYSDCRYFKRKNNSIDLITNDRKISIDTHASNLLFFTAMLKKYNVKELKTK